MDISTLAASPMLKFKIDNVAGIAVKKIQIPKLSKPYVLIIKSGNNICKTVNEILENINEVKFLNTLSFFFLSKKNKKNLKIFINMFVCAKIY